MSRIDLLRNTSLFAGLPEEELRAVAASLRAQTFAPNMVLFHKGRPGQSLYLVEAGRVRIFVLSDTGHEITLNIHDAGECFGELALLDGMPRSAGAMTLEATVLLSLHRDDFLDLIERHPKLARRIIELLSSRLRHATAYAEGLAFLDVPGRIAAVLLELARRYGVETPAGIQIDLQMTQTDLATWVAASREMVNKALGVFRELGLLRTSGHTITILDPEGLRARIVY